MIENRQFRIPRPRPERDGSICEAIERVLGAYALRWYVTEAGAEEWVVEATLVDGCRASAGSREERAFHPGKSVVLSIVPTGVGCSIGGYAGDAAPVTSLLAATADYLITNPNAVNASDFIGLADNVLYTEGLCIDLLCKGLTDLYLPRANRVGLVVEQAAGERLDTVFNVVNAVRAVHGVDIDCEVTVAPAGSRCVKNRSGAFTGTVDRPEVILDAAEILLARGANAIAVTTDIQDLPEEDYRRHFDGRCPNPMGGVEAVISHLVVDRLRVPAAHAPMINARHPGLLDPVVDARSAGEITSASGLACVLVGLRRAPQLRRAPGCRLVDVVNVHNLVAVVAPASGLGGIPVLCAVDQGIPVIAVAENETILRAGKVETGFAGVLEAHSYAEAAGLVLALRHGIAPASLVRPLETLRPERREIRGARSAVEEPLRLAG
ncbi:MAG TPA: DUF3326 domain-containing protein [Thermoanaerobaculia bacterium]|nr:DUF3326 domain-containing protein [Thermoanaerobaculia bacterium]